MFYFIRSKRLKTTHVALIPRKQFCRITSHFFRKENRKKKKKNRWGATPPSPKGAATPTMGWLERPTLIRHLSKGGNKWGATHPPPQRGGHPFIRIGSVNHPFSLGSPPLQGGGFHLFFFFLIYQNEVKNQRVKM
jgi:hypothetical protein